MKIFRRHIVKIAKIPSYVMRDRYFHMLSNDLSYQDKRLLTQGFEDGYAQCLTDLGIKAKDHPKGRRE